MTTPEDMKDLFVESQAAYATAIGASSDDGIKRLYEAFVNALQSIDVPGGEDELSDILISDDDHKTKHDGRMFDRIEPPLKSYNSVISGDATNYVHTKVERL